MRKVLILLAMCFAFSLTAITVAENTFETLSDAELVDMKNSAASEMTKRLAAELNTELEGCEVREYDWISGSSQYKFLAVKNVSGYDATIELTALFMDKDGAVIGVKNLDVRACENGYETLWVLRNDGPFDEVMYDITLSPESYYKAAQSVVQLNASISGDKAIITAKNTGEVPVEFVEYSLLYFNATGDVVGYSWGYLTDKDSEIKPGKTIFREEECNTPFTAVELFAIGRIN